MMIRSFLPVGQGACYMERFRDVDNDDHNITVLYDCGSSTSVDHLKKCLRDNLSDGSTIHAVFISHFDEDHINGLPFILENYDVKHLFIPLITEDELNVIRLGCLCGGLFPSNNEFFRDFFSEYPYFRRTIDGKTDVRFIDEYRNENENYEELPRWDLWNRLIHSGDDISDLVFPSKYYGVTDDWLYVPFNFQQEKRYGELIDELQKIYGLRITVKDALDIIKTDPSEIDRIKCAYKKVSGSLNANSMVLFSGTTNQNIRQEEYNVYSSLKKKCCIERCCRCYRAKAGCLYMGDYDAHGKRKWNDLRNAFSNYWELIGCIQIPHHGSKHNFNKELTCYRWRYYVISAGVKNKYWHPNSCVIKDMLFKGAQLRVVTEEKESELILLVQ